MMEVKGAAPKEQQQSYSLTSETLNRKAKRKLAAKEKGIKKSKPKKK
jgi:hypothetical protein